MTFRTDITEAKSAVQRAQEINAKAEIERQSFIKAANAAVTVILSIAALAAFFVLAEHRLETQDKRNQEQTWNR